jgi:hypothetical protein
MAAAGLLRGVLIVLAVLSNAMLALVALSPTFVSFADSAPSGVTCAGCDAPDVQWALTRAAFRGREQILAIIDGNRTIILGLAAMNVILLVVLSWRTLR